MIKNIVLVGIGASIGGILRYLTTLIVKNQTYPFATFLVNIIGCLAIGIVFAYTEKQTTSNETLKVFLATGICGGFTTFSAFSLENMQLLKQGNYITAALYITVSILFCIAATFTGYKLLSI